MKGEEVGSKFDFPLSKGGSLDTGRSCIPAPWDLHFSFLLIFPKEFGIFLFVGLVFLEVSFCIGARFG